MTSKRKIVYSGDLLSIVEAFQSKLREIKESLGCNILINQGLFLMTTAYFESSIRELMRIVLVSFPEKMDKEYCTISKDQICEIADKGHSVIIDSKLYILFKQGVRIQLEKLLKTLFNKECQNKNSGSPNSIEKEKKVKETIIKLEEISFYRNALIHNGGKASIEINERAKFFKPTDTGGALMFDSNLIESFISEYSSFFSYLKDCINNTFRPYESLSQIERVKKLWESNFSSPILRFEDYWDIDYKRDLVIGIKYPDTECCISSSEKILLSIWRHQFDDSIRTKEFLLCSVDYNKIYEIYKGLDDLKFYHMRQKAQA